jgi:hypothetical protein
MVRIEIVADSVADAASKMLAWATVLTEGLKVTGVDTPDTETATIVKASLDGFTAEEKSASTPSAEARPKRGRGRPRKQPAAEPASPEAEEPAAEEEPSATEDEPPAEEEETDPFETAQEAEPELTGKEAKALAWQKLQEAYVLPANRQAVTEIRMQFGVAKFADIPDDRGHELLAAAEDLTRRLSEKQAA